MSAFRLFDEYSNFLDAVGGNSAVQDSMAIRTHGPQILDRIDRVCRFDFRERSQVVNVDEAFGYRSVDLAEVHGTDRAIRSVGCDTLTPRFWIALEGVDGDGSGGTLDDSFRPEHFFGEIMSFESSVSEAFEFRYLFVCQIS